VQIEMQWKALAYNFYAVDASDARLEAVSRPLTLWHSRASRRNLAQTSECY